jgi:hypothetical protein
MSILDELHQLRHQRPFVPFMIVLNDGRQFQVDRPLQFAFTEDQLVFLDNKTGSEHAKPSDIVELKQLHTVK